MVVYFCHRLSDNFVGLSDLYVDRSVFYVDLSDHFVGLPACYSVLMPVTAIYLRDSSRYFEIRVQYKTVC